MVIFSKKIQIIIISLSLLILTNCTPARIVGNDYNPKTTKTEKVRIVRKQSVVLSLVPAIFGYDEKDKVKLKNGDEAVIEVPTGKREFFVRSNQADRPKKVIVDLKKGEPVCFNSKPGSLTVLKSFLLPWYYFSSAFELDKQKECIID